MAVDTAGKRYSMMGWGAPAPPSPLPVPDGEVGAADKLHLLGLYSGISVQSVGITLYWDVEVTATAAWDIDIG